ncbi:TetR family transcriptional regulator [Planomicrobium okeanokoites]|uniref:TetR family transcriptional regulator n=1 Tax=Planomicrobium okeanokoites TaxID=244 RepID=UPI0024926548|nr:TetR family transcriptional regulator [Planomicrobium okeanokoites]
MLMEEQLYAVSDKKGKPLKIFDADWKQEFGLALVLERGNKKLVQVNGRDIDTSFISNSISHIRWIDADTILLAEEKLRIIDMSGKLLHTFNAGEAIENIIVEKAGIWVSYFDEGIGEEISDEGLRLFDFKGKTLFRYHSDLLHRPTIFSCYGLCKGKGENVWIFPYTDFQLVDVNPNDRTLRIYSVPNALHGSSAICIRGKYAYFFSPYHLPGQMLQLEIGTQNYEFLGEIKGRLRGLNPKEDYHFLNISEKDVKLCKILNDKEFDF